MRFTIYNVATLGTNLWQEQRSNIPVTSGLFSTPLGDFIPFSGAWTDNTDLWLEVAIDLNKNGTFESGEVYAPRQKLASSPWAINARMLEGKGAPYFWQIFGNTGTVPGGNFLGTTDNVAFEMRVNNARALRIEPGGASPNLIGGYSGNSAMTAVSGATVGGGGFPGQLNRAGERATVAGGASNVASGRFSSVGGGWGNTASGDAATIGGGGTNDYALDGNTASAISSTIGGGSKNIAAGYQSTIGGGNRNAANAWGSTVGGGEYNTGSGSHAAVAGGRDNTSSGTYSFVGGGYHNQAKGYAATVGGGGGEFSSTAYPNRANGDWSTIAGGIGNTAGSIATVGGGESNSASGSFATVPGGISNLAAGNFSFAAGRRAKANHQGCFVWADAVDADLPTGNDNQFLVRATGGAYFVTGTSLPPPGVSLPPGGSAWQSLSDRNAKENFADVDGRDVLAHLAAVPVQTWNLKSQNAAIRHIGPMAQDFYAAFNVGEDNIHITTSDADGVALAAVQGLYRMAQEKDAQIAALKTEKDTEIADLKARLASLEKLMIAQTQRQP
jgi:hypothetical protein